MDEIAGELVGLFLRGVGASPVLTGAIQRLVPALVSYARKAIDRGADPEAELVLMMAGAEEAARQAERAKFGP